MFCEYLQELQLVSAYSDVLGPPWVAWEGKRFTPNLVISCIHLYNCMIFIHDVLKTKYVDHCYMQSCMKYIFVTNVFVTKFRKCSGTQEILVQYQLWAAKTTKKTTNRSLWLSEAIHGMFTSNLFDLIRMSFFICLYVAVWLGMSPLQATVTIWNFVH